MAYAADSSSPKSAPSHDTLTSLGSPKPLGVPSPRHREARSSRPVAGSPGPRKANGSHVVLEPPNITSTDFPPNGNAAAGTDGTFTLTVSAGSPVVRFIYNYGDQPPVITDGSCATETSWPGTVDVTNSTATIMLDAPPPGNQVLYAYSCDAAGDASSSTHYDFSVGRDPTKSYPSLQAAFNNTAISDDSEPSTANADGSGDSLSAQDLAAAGWVPGGNVTVDGATFTLPEFGSGQPDNLLAQNQYASIAMNGGKGDALVILATTTNANYAADYPLSNFTYNAVPVPPAGTSTAGTNCALLLEAPPGCAPPGVEITYTDGSSVDESLNVPDWSQGPAAMAVLSLPHHNSPTGQTDTPARIYAFAMPLVRGAGVASVTLPDADATFGAGDPGLHIFGMAIRDTTSAPGGATWTGAWASPNDDAYGADSTTPQWGRQTFRVVATPTASGDTARLKLSNNVPGMTSPLRIGHVTIATASSGATPTAPPTTATFGGSQAFTIPIGGDAYSDPVSFPVTAGNDVMISVYLASGTLDYIPEHAYAGAVEYTTRPGSGDHTADTSGMAFAGNPSGEFTNLFTDLDVTGNGNTASTVAVLGDNLVDPGAVTNLATRRVSDDLAANISSNTQGVPEYGVLGEGIAGNDLITDKGAGGISALSRIDRDILDQPNIGTVVIDEGLNDLFDGANPLSLFDGDTELINQLNSFGVSVIIATLTPCDGYSVCTNAVDNDRTIVNTWIDDELGNLAAPWLYPVDFSSAVGVADPTSTETPPEQELDNAAPPNDDDAGDHVDLTADGYASITNTIPLTDLTPYTPPSS